jgi:hypothetical protein
MLTAADANRLPANLSIGSQIATKREARLDDPSSPRGQPRIAADDQDDWVGLVAAITGVAVVPE